MGKLFSSDCSRMRSRNIAAQELDKTSDIKQWIWNYKSNIRDTYSQFISQCSVLFLTLSITNGYFFFYSIAHEIYGRHINVKAITGQLAKP